MELLLNSVWLAIAAASLTNALRYRRTKSHLAVALHSAVAVACMLVLLFPVISITDDLHGEQIAVDDSAVVVKKALRAAAAISGAAHDTALAAVPFVLHTPTLHLVEEAASRPIQCAQPGTWAQYSGRAPPALNS